MIARINRSSGTEHWTHDTPRSTLAPTNAGARGTSAPSPRALAEIGGAAAKRARGRSSRCSWRNGGRDPGGRSEKDTSEIQSRPHILFRLLLSKKKKYKNGNSYSCGEWAMPIA